MIIYKLSCWFILALMGIIIKMKLILASDISFITSRGTIPSTSKKNRLRLTV